MDTFPSRKAGYPGSFNPPTVAHLAIAAAAREQRGLDRVDFVVSRRALDKEHVMVPPLEERLAVLEASVADVPWLHVVVTEQQLLADIADGYDVLIMGADKWHQIQELRFYDSPAHRAESMARLPELAIAARADSGEVPAEARLDVAAEMMEISSSGARAGQTEWMTPAAQEWVDQNGSWPSSSRQ